MNIESILNILGIIIWSLLAGARLNQIISGNFWLIPVFLHSLLAVLLLIRHRSPVKVAPAPQILIAWVSVSLPLAMQVSQIYTWGLRALSVLAVIFSIWALLALGKSFGVAPADRGLINQGPYRYVRHPMYMGEVLSTLVLLPGNASLPNLILMGGVILTIILRIIWEENIIKGYLIYAHQVRWRLVPGVW
jgi:protein-S-isoprenylcysteine O-methyltransferase Ste14